MSQIATINDKILAYLPNGILEVTDSSFPEKSGREVLFLARLHPRKRPVAFVKMAALLVPKYPNVSFCLVGPDEGELREVESELSTTKLREIVSVEGGMAPSLTQARMAKASVYVLPSYDEPFGMTVIEALMVGVPVVITQSCALAEFVVANDCGLVVDGTPESMARAVGALIDNPDRAVAMGLRGRDAVRETFSMKRVCDILEQRYFDQERA